MLFSLIIVYCSICYLLTRLPRREICLAEVGGGLPHGAAVTKRFFGRISIFWGGAVLGLILFARNSSPDVSDGIISALFLFVTVVCILGVFSLFQSALINSSVEVVQEDPLSYCRLFPYTLILAHPATITAIMAHQKISNAIEKTPFPCALVAAVDFIDEIAENFPGARLFPWDSDLQTVFVDSFAAISEQSAQKVSEAMDSAAEAKTLTKINQDLQSDIALLKKTNLLLDQTLHEMRSRASTGSIDPARMTVSQASEERRKLEERIRAIDARLSEGGTPGQFDFQKPIRFSQQ